MIFQHFVKILDFEELFGLVMSNMSSSLLVSSVQLLCLTFLRLVLNPLIFWSLSVG